MTNNDTPAAGKCETCDGKGWVPADDPAPNHFTDECPDCRPAAQTQGQRVRRTEINATYFGGSIRDSVDVVKASDYDRLLAANERLVSALLSAYRHMQSVGCHESYLIEQRTLLTQAGYVFDDQGYYVPDAALAAHRAGAV